MSESGPGALRARREALGLDLAQVSHALRIPIAHLRAIEEGRFGDLPPGPYARGYVRAYCEHLGVPPPRLERTPVRRPKAPTPGPSRPVWIARVAAGVMCVVLAGLLVQQVLPDAASDVTLPTPAAGPGPDQVVRVRVERPGRFRVLVDGELVLDRRARPGEDLEVAGHDRVEVHLPAAESARVEYNGVRVAPQGRQDLPRRLVFIDDLEEPAVAPRDDARPGE